MAHIQYEGNIYPLIVLTRKETILKKRFASRIRSHYIVIGSTLVQNWFRFRNLTYNPTVLKNVTARFTRTQSTLPEFQSIWAYSIGLITNFAWFINKEKAFSSRNILTETIFKRPGRNVSLTYIELAYARRC